MQSVFFSTKFADYPLAERNVIDAYDAEMKRIDGLVEPVAAKKRAIERPHRDRLFEERIRQLPDYMQLAWRTPANQRTEGQRLNARQIEKTLKIEEEELLAVMSKAEKRERLQLTCKIDDSTACAPRNTPPPASSPNTAADPLPSFFLHRGSPDMKGSRMGPGVLSVVARSDVPFPEPPAGAPTTERRKHLRGMAHITRPPAHCPSHGQPHLATSLR